MSKRTEFWVRTKNGLWHRPLSSVNLFDSSKNEVFVPHHDDEWLHGVPEVVAGTVKFRGAMRRLLAFVPGPVCEDCVRFWWECEEEEKRFNRRGRTSRAPSAPGPPRSSRGRA